MSKKFKNLTPGPGEPLIPGGTSQESDPDSKKEDKKTKKPTCPITGDHRRSFLKTTAAAGLGIVAVGAPLCGATRMVLAPASQKGLGGKFYPLATPESLTESPQKFTIVDEYKDAWTTTPDQKIGTVYLRKSGNDFQAFHSACPHLKCQVLVGKITNPKTKEVEELFYCPCHSAHFTLDGTRIDDVSPRDLDSLEIKIVDGMVCVRYENFTSGIAEKKALS